MRPLKAVLGVGAACAACCAIPLVGGVAALTAGTALPECVDEFAPFATGLLILAGVGGAVTWWVRRRRRNRAPGASVAADPAQRQLLQALPQAVGAVTSQGLWLQPSGRVGDLRWQHERTSVHRPGGLPRRGNGANCPVLQGDRSAADSLADGVRAAKPRSSDRAAPCLHRRCRVFGCSIDRILTVVPVTPNDTVELDPSPVLG